MFVWPDVWLFQDILYNHILNYIVSLELLSISDWSGVFFCFFFVCFFCFFFVFICCCCYGGGWWGLGFFADYLELSIYCLVFSMVHRYSVGIFLSYSGRWVIGFWQKAEYF